MNSEITHIAKLFASLQHGDCWIGINFKDALANITAEKAIQANNAGGNSIWQLVNHLIYWRTVTVTRLGGSLQTPPFDDFMLPDELTAANWKQTLLDFEAAYHQLRTAVLHFNAEHLHNPSPKKEQTFYELLMGCLQHDSYHLGQLVILKKNTNEK
jgi:uncharacterized damage-inducible protein DinB